MSDLIVLSAAGRVAIFEMLVAVPAFYAEDSFFLEAHVLEVSSMRFVALVVLLQTHQI